MSPFDLSGPAFLLFYFVFGIVVCVVLRRAIAHSEAAGAWAPPRNDPYLIAFLRAGAAESVKLAVLALIDRGLLRYERQLLTLTRADADQFVQRDIEREVIQRCAVGAGSNADKVLIGAPRMAACEAYRAELVAGGFLAGPATARLRRPAVLLALLLLIGVGVTKIVLAFARGRHNVLLLLVLMAVFSAIAAWRLLPDSTGRGKVALENLRTLFARLRTRASSMVPGGETNEMALLAAVFGLGALPARAFPYAQQMYGHKPASSDGGSGSSSDSSGCGSSDGGSSSGCGGGGGCGGCGS